MPSSASLLTPPARAPEGRQTAIEDRVRDLERRGRAGQAGRHGLQAREGGPVALGRLVGGDLRAEPLLAERASGPLADHRLAQVRGDPRDEEAVEQEQAQPEHGER